MDIGDTIAPKSDQLNAEDLLSGERTFTITEVLVVDSPEQPVSIYLAEFPKDRPWKPSKTSRRVMIMGWGNDSKTYAGHRITLYRDPEIKFGGDKVGGVKIRAMSHLPGNKRLAVALTVTRGKRAPYVVEPLPAEAATSPAVSADTLLELNDTFVRKGIPDDSWLSGVNHITGGSATDLECITEDEARQVLAALEKRPDAGVAGEQGGE